MSLPQVCTGVSAAWCPIHGDCECPEDNFGYRDFEAGNCPLHSPDSLHGEETLEQTLRFYQALAD